MLYKGVYARVENDIRVHWFIGVGSIIHGNKGAVKKYLKYFGKSFLKTCWRDLKDSRLLGF